MPARCGAYDVIATSKTDSTGEWSFEGPLQSAYQDKYKVEAAPKKPTLGPKHKHNCVADKTAFTFDVPSGG